MHILPLEVCAQDEPLLLGKSKEGKKNRKKRRKKKGRRRKNRKKQSKKTQTRNVNALFVTYHTPMSARPAQFGLSVKYVEGGTI